MAPVARFMTHERHEHVHRRAPSRRGRAGMVVPVGVLLENLTDIALPPRRRGGAAGRNQGKDEAEDGYASATARGRRSERAPGQRGTTAPGHTRPVRPHLDFHPLPLPTFREPIARSVFARAFIPPWIPACAGMTNKDTHTSHKPSFSRRHTSPFPRSLSSNGFHRGAGIQGVGETLYSKWRRQGVRSRCPGPRPAAGR